MRGAGTSIAGNAVGTGHRRRHRPAPQPGARRSTPRPAPPSSQPGVVHAALQRAAAPHGLRFGPDPSTHTRCTIGGMIGNNACGSRALGYGRTVDNVVGARRADRRRRRLRLGAARRRRRLDRLRRAGRPSTSAHVRTEFGRFGRQVSRLLASSTCCPRTAATLDRFLVGTEGTLGRRRSRRPSGWSRTTRAGAGRARLPVDGRGRRRRARRCCAHRPLIACEGLDSAHRRPGPGRAAAPCPTCRAGAGWLFVEVAGDDAGEVAARPRPWPRRRRARRTAWSTDAARGGRAVADPRGRRRPGRAHAWPRPAYSGWEDAAVPPERLGAYLRDFDALLQRARPRRRALRPLRRRLRARAHRLPARAQRGGPRGVPRRSSRRARRRWSRATAARCPASTATAGPARSCCR